MVSCSGAPVSVQSRWNHHRLGSTPSATRPSIAARRRARGTSMSARERRHVAVASRTDTGSSNGPSRDLRPRTASSSTNREAAADPSDVVWLAVNTTRSWRAGRASCGTGVVHPPAARGCVRTADTGARAPPSRTWARAATSSGSSPRPRRKPRPCPARPNRTVRRQHANRIQLRRLGTAVTRPVDTGVERLHERLYRGVGRIAGLGHRAG